MPLISTDYRDYLTPEGPSGRTLGARLRAHAVKPMARVASYILIAFGITFIGWGAGFDSAWILGMLFAYPVSESLEWIVDRARRRVIAARTAV